MLMINAIVTWPVNAAIELIETGRAQWCGKILLAFVPQKMLIAQPLSVKDHSSPRPAQPECLPKAHNSCKKECLLLICTHEIASCLVCAVE